MSSRKPAARAGSKGAGETRAGETRAGTAKSARAAGAGPSGADKAAFVKAMWEGIRPGSKAAVKSAARKQAPAAKTATKKTAAGKAASKTAKRPGPAATDMQDTAPANAPVVEILRRIPATRPVENTPQSEQALALARLIDTALTEGDLERIQPHAVQALMGALCKYYAANDEAGNRYPLISGRAAISGTDVMIVCGALLKAVDLQVFELGMWQSWSNR